MRSAIFTVILATFASTIPITGVDLDQKINGTVIPLTKRSSWLGIDNSVDFDALHLHVESVDAKIRRGLENYERNTGMSHSHSLAAKGTHRLNLRKRAVGAAALTGYNNVVWYGTITIGTPPKPFIVDIDTGFSDLFIPGPTCSGCSGHIRWDPASSRTAEAKGSTFNIRFEDGAIASGNQYTDKVTVAGLTVDIQTIGVATTYIKMVSPPDGMLGMAFQSMSSYHASPLFETLVNEGRVTEPMFSVKLTSDGGELYLGGTNDELYEGEITYTPVTEVGYWQVNIMKIQTGDRTLLGNIAAIIDTGSNLIVGDWWQVAQMHLNLGGKAIRRGYYSFPCDSFPTISFHFGSSMFDIPPSILNVGRIRPGSPDCFSGVVGMSTDGLWSLGGVFLKSVYTVFDFGNQRVGFAKLA